MKYLLGGTALAALAIAVPVWAQAPMSSGAAQPSAQPAPEAQKHRTYAHAHHGRYVRQVHHRGYARWAGRGPTDNVANQLNRAQLGGAAYGSGMPPAGYQPGPGYPPAGYMPGGPRPSGH